MLIDPSRRWMMERLLYELEDLFCLFCDGVYKVFLVSLFFLELAIVFILFPLAIFGGLGMLWFNPTSIAVWVLVVILCCLSPALIKHFWKNIKSTWQAFIQNLKDSDN